MNRCSEKLINDPEQLNLINQKLQLIYNLQKKHQVSTVDDLIVIQSNLENAVLELGNIDEEIVKLTDLVDANVKQLDQICDDIHAKRVEAIPILSQKLITILETLGMPNVRFNMDIKGTSTYFENGKD